jgi:hypothetical protein
LPTSPLTFLKSAHMNLGLYLLSSSSFKKLMPLFLRANVYIYLAGRPWHIPSVGAQPLYRTQRHQTSIGYAANLTHPQTVRYLKRLVDEGLLILTDFEPFWCYEVMDKGMRSEVIRWNRGRFKNCPRHVITA